MEKAEIIDLLKKLGLTSYESQVYLALTFIGPSKVSAISSESKVPQAKVYGVLDNLMDKQLVEIFNVKPREFKAVPPELSIKQRIEEKEKQIKAVKEKFNNLLASIKSSQKEEQLVEGIWTVKGKKHSEFFNRLTNIFERSRDYVYVVTRDFTWSSNLSESVKRAIKRGVKVRTIAIKEIDPDIYYRAKWFNDIGVEIRVFPLKIHPRIVVADGKEVLLRIDHQPTQMERFPFTSIWSGDVSLVTLFDIYMKSLWKMGKPADFKKIPSRTK
ncbi:MAG: hypothetical protein J4452_03950 [Candidatus Aenigmarchaeota archaeon]|nr:hypothetical protein [Candidatus Aenigmarchaeota archaeon]